MIISQVQSNYASILRAVMDRYPVDHAKQSAAFIRILFHSENTQWGNGSMLIDSVVRADHGSINRYGKVSTFGDFNWMSDEEKKVFNYQNSIQAIMADFSTWSGGPEARLIVLGNNYRTTDVTDMVNMYDINLLDDEDMVAYALTWDTLV